MYNVEIKNSCSCAIKKGMPELQSFVSEEEAETEANRLKARMEKEFCKKHRFELRKEFSSFCLYILPNR